MRAYSRWGLSCLAGIVSLTNASAGPILYQENFDDANGFARWLSYQSSGDAQVSYDYDYVTDLAIPAAPHSAPGNTLGMRFLVNQSTNVFQGISASPLDQHFTGDFTMHFDLWINFVGPFPNLGSGSTQMASFGWGTTGGSSDPAVVGTTQWAASKHSVLFAGTGDGDTSQDYRVYVRAYEASAGATQGVETGFYAAGTAADARNNTNPYYAQFGGKQAPEAQVDKFNALGSNQSGTTFVGTLGMAWHDVKIERLGDVVTWSVDDLLIATVPLMREDGTLANVSGDNIFFGMFDINANSSTDPNNYLNAAIFDNIVVTTPVPEPGMLGIAGMTAAGLAMHRRRRRP